MADDAVRAGGVEVFRIGVPEGGGIGHEPARVDLVDARPRGGPDDAGEELHFENRIMGCPSQMLPVPRGTSFPERFLPRVTEMSSPHILKRRTPGKGHARRAERYLTRRLFGQILGRIERHPGTPSCHLS